MDHFHRFRRLINLAAPTTTDPTRHIELCFRRNYLLATCDAKSKPYSKRIARVNRAVRIARDFAVTREFVRDRPEVIDRTHSKDRLTHTRSGFDCWWKRSVAVEFYFDR